MGGAGGGGCARCAAVVTAAGAEYSYALAEGSLCPILLTNSPFTRRGAASPVPDSREVAKKKTVEMLALAGLR